MTLPGLKSLTRRLSQTIAYLKRRGKKTAALAGLLGGMLVASPAAAASLSALDDPSLGKDRYDRCVELVKRDAAAAIEQAAGWYKEKGGGAALHCQALALVQLKRYGQAGEKLEQAAREDPAGSAPRRAALLDQAGNAWLLAGQAVRAESAFSAALLLAPQDEDLLADRARARGLRKDWTGADADLSAVLSLDPNRADALVLRASARHAQGRKADAGADIDRALEIDPEYPQALLERGDMKLGDGNLAGARADWQRVVRDAPGSDAAASAQSNLQSSGELAGKPAKH
ncbi:MAG TPA: hypothetical protein VII49_02865 [Rhizomicrobium sp.]